MLVTSCQIILNKNMFSHNCISGWHWVQKLQFLEMTVIKWSLCSGVHLGQGRTYLQNCLKTRTNPSVVVVVRVKRLRCVVQQMNTFMSQRRSQWASESRPFAYLLIWFFSAVVTFASLNTRCQLFVMKFLCNTHTHTQSTEGEWEPLAVLRHIQLPHFLWSAQSVVLTIRAPCCRPYITSSRFLKIQPAAWDYTRQLNKWWVTLAMPSQVKTDMENKKILGARLIFYFLFIHNITFSHSRWHKISHKNVIFFFPSRRTNLKFGLQPRSPNISVMRWVKEEEKKKGLRWRHIYIHFIG